MAEPSPLTTRGRAPSALRDVGGAGASAESPAQTAPHRHSGGPTLSVSPARHSRTGAVRPDVVVYVCRNSRPEGCSLPRQWQQDGAHVVARVVPCSGKTDAQYLMSALEGGVRGICVVACPQGECRLAQGNYRAEVRVRTIRRLLTEVGLEPGRVELVRSSPAEPPEVIEARVRESVARICASSANPEVGA
jgi:F420-non-reducing hydrogenase iron-sulfur subunit